MEVLGAGKPSKMKGECCNYKAIREPKVFVFFFFLLLLLFLIVVVCFDERNRNMF